MKLTSTERRRLMTPEQRAAELAQKRASYAANREQRLAYAAAYREANAEQIKASVAGKHATYSARYREKNYQRCLAMTAAWKSAKPEQRKATQRDWLQNNLDKHRTYQHNRRAKKKANGGKLSPNIADRLLMLQRGKCACCGLPLGDDYHLDHIVPIALGGPNTDENIQLLRAECNRQKGARDPIAYMQARGRLL